MPKLQDKVAVITGGGRGLGKAFALKYAEEGAKLFIPDISLERALETVAEIKAMGGDATATLCDISDEKSVTDMAEALKSAYGRADILVNNAAIWAGLNITPWNAWTTADWERIFKVNVIGTWLVCKAVVPMMGQGGKIINIASNVPRVPASQVFMPYACTKGTMYTFTHSLAHALGPNGINVNALAPGYTATQASLDQRDSEGTFKLATSEQTFQRREEAGDLVGTALFLASADSDFITGQYIVVNGGSVLV